MLFGGAKITAYSAYGELLTEKTSGFGYNGEYYDAATGMLNLRARQYESAQARFSQRDSLKGSSAAPRSLNVYLYCQNDAINFFDASGAAMAPLRPLNVPVAMTDGGSNATRLITATRPSAVETAAANAASAARAAAASSQAQISSMIRDSRDPAIQLQQARMNRAQAQATTPTVSGRSFLRSTPLTACMTQEEYDDYWIIYGVDMPSDTPSPTSQQKKDAKQYSWQSAKAFLLGDYSDEDPTLLSIAGSIAAGLFDVDLPLDLRDAYYDITHYNELERPWLTLGIDLIAFIPVIGTLEYADDFADLVKHADDIADIAKYSDDVFDCTRHADDVADWLDGFGDGTKHLDDVSDASKVTDDITDAVKLSRKQVMEYAEMATKGPIDSDIVVIGKKIENSADSYEEVAKRMNAQYFELENWRELSATYPDDEMWKINEEFLESQIEAGKEIYITSDPFQYIGNIGDESGFAKEINYLQEKQFWFIEEGGLWHAVKLP